MNTAIFEAFADPDNPVVPAYETEFTEFGLRSDYWSGVSNYPKGLQHLAPPDFHWLPLDMRAEAHFAADRTSAGYRRLLREMGSKARA